jgi:hypothetical protein
MNGSGHTAIPAEMNRSEQVQKPVLYCSYFVLDNTPNPDYISAHYPGRRPNPAQLIDIVNRKLAMHAPVRAKREAP